MDAQRWPESRADKDGILSVARCTEQRVALPGRFTIILVKPSAVDFLSTAGIPPDSGRSELTLHTAVVGPIPAGRHSTSGRLENSGTGQTVENDIRGWGLIDAGALSESAACEIQSPGDR